MARVRHTPEPEWSSLKPFQVSRWGKFWSLEPVFAEERQWLVAKGGPQPALGDLVLAEPAYGNRLRIVEILGSSNDLSAVLEALLHAREIRQGFADDIKQEARSAASLSAHQDAGRVDLAEVPTFTIDPDSARDFDDAISVAAEGDGYRVWVHIADVSYFVEGGGAIDREARRRTTSIYLPLWAEPMLPEELSSGVCSLRPREPRKCLTAEMTFDRRGRRTSVRFYRSTITSDHRLTYGFVDHVFAEHGVTLPAEHLPGEPPRSTSAGDSKPVRGEAPPTGAEGATFDADEQLTGHLLRAWELAAILRHRRFERGALRIGSFEPEYRFDAEGRLIGASSRPETPSHALVEEYMLAANEAVAEYLVRRHARTIYRVHEPPDGLRAEALMEELEELQVPTPPFPDGHSATPEQVAGGLRRLSEMLPGFCAREHRGCLAFPQLLLRSLKQAVYLPENRGHFGLASSGYLHFTSPIRRYPDLVVHRALCAELGVGGEQLDDVTLAEVAEHCSMMERVAAKVELTADDIALSFLLDRTLTEQGWDKVFSGEVVGLVGGGLFVHFGGCYQGFLPSRRLADERFYESETGGALIGSHTGQRWRLGDRVSVRVERIEKVRGRVQLELAGEEGERAEKDRQGAGHPARGRAPGRRRPPSRSPARRSRRRR